MSDIEVDSYGFNKNFKYNRSKDYTSKKPLISTRNFIKITTVTHIQQLLIIKNC